MMIEVYVITATKVEYFFGSRTNNPKKISLRVCPGDGIRNWAQDPSDGAHGPVQAWQGVVAGAYGTVAELVLCAQD